MLSFFEGANTKNLRLLGIHRIHIAGRGTVCADRVRVARNVRIMAVSASSLIKNLKEEILYALHEQRASFRVLIAEPNSQFVEDVEKIESKHRIGQISQEIITTENLLVEYIECAALNRRIEEIGTVQIGHYTTHLRSSLILCDENWGWLTLNLPPVRAVQSVSLELIQTKNGLLSNCREHFDACWEVVEKRGRVSKLLPAKTSEVIQNASSQNVCTLDISELRVSLSRNFDDVEIDTLCLEEFPDIFEKFSRGTRKDEKINLLLNACRNSETRAHKLVQLLEQKAGAEVKGADR